MLQQNTDQSGAAIVDDLFQRFLQAGAGFLRHVEELVLQSLKIIEHYFGPGSFSLVRGSRPGVPTKPDPAGVYSLMADLGAAPESTLFVGDSDVDILTGHNAGLPALGVLWGFRGEAELTAAGADALAAKPEDILAYLRCEKH